MEQLISLLEIIGLLAFAITGSLEAIKSKTDLLGVVILGVVTSVGGGIIRDLVLGITPPNAFKNPIAIYIATFVSLAVFVTLYYNKKVLGNTSTKYFGSLLTATDAIGLAVFTILGMNVAASISMNLRGVVFIFVGVITGVGGGVVRDVLLGKVPYILEKNVYASASILGAIIYYLLIKYQVFNSPTRMMLSIGIIFITRMIAAKNNIQLPKAN